MATPDLSIALADYISRQSQAPISMLPAHGVLVGMCLRALSAYLKNLHRLPIERQLTCPVQRLNGSTVV